MSANDKRLRSPYNAEDPLGGLIEILNESANFTASARKTVTDTQIICIPYILVAVTGQYPEDFQVRRTQDNKSWTAFKAHFIEAQADL